MPSAGMWADYEGELRRAWSTYDGLPVRAWNMLPHDRLLELRYFIKGEAREALEGISDKAKMVLEMLKRALEMGIELTDKVIALLAEFWGFHRGNGQKPSTTSTAVELELVGILANHKKSRRDPITARKGKPKGGAKAGHARDLQVEDAAIASHDRREDVNEEMPTE